MTMFKVKQDAFLKERVMYSLFSLHAGFSILQHNSLRKYKSHKQKYYKTWFNDLCIDLIMFNLIYIYMYCISTYKCYIGFNSEVINYINEPQITSF